MALTFGTQSGELLNYEYRTSYQVEPKEYYQALNNHRSKK